MRVPGEKYVDKYITDALFELMKEKAYQDITTTEIIERAGVVKMSFYRNFKSKEDVIRKWIETVTEIFLQQSNISLTDDTSGEFFLKLFTHLYGYRERTTLLYEAELTHLLRTEFEKRFLAHRYSKYNTYEIYFIAGGVFNVYYYWLAGGHRESPKELTEKLLKLL